MNKLIITVIIVFVALASVGSIIIFSGDGSTLVPPPEKVSESFFKQLEMKRYSRALPLLEQSLLQDVDRYVLSELRRELELNTGSIMKIKGKSGEIHGSRADAMVEIQGDKVSVDVPVKLVRQQGVWKVYQVFL